MESQVVSQRRLKMIVGHFAGTEDVSATHLFPLNCSSFLNSVVQRCDSRMLFARQGSISQACFMREVSIEQNFRQGNSFQPAMPTRPRPSGSAIKDFSSNVATTPIFSRPVQAKPDLPNVAKYEPVKEECKLSMDEPPMFARPNRGFNAEKQISSEKIGHATGSNGTEWSPRMDVAESGCTYTMTLEVPGVNSNDIRVEINNQNLIITGNRSTQLWRMASSQDISTKYHKREISQGPYKVVWPLPSDEWVPTDHSSKTLRLKAKAEGY
ncbi:Alpha crystallin/Hsp20 domain [Macleaya cordata]|uniref:Alpha crystallin/Hsp20 domain n=1 Tax=Macleaya cordata TaxID=56857 RepID=A0A200PSA7_MACCD|nr:Alpha crystallin/Hsp20 domain [Macleaya cordata]